MRFWDCCGLWCDKLWMLVRVLTGGSPPPETEICQGARRDDHRQWHSQRGAPPGPLPCRPPASAGRSEGGVSAKPPPRWGTFGSAHTAPTAPRGCRPRLGCPNIVLMNSEAAAVKDLAGTGFQLRRSTVPGHGTSRAFAVSSPKSKFLPSGTAEDSQHSLTSNHGCRRKWEIQTREVRKKKKKDRKQIKRASRVMISATTFVDGQDTGEVSWVHSARASSWDFGSAFRDQTLGVCQEDWSWSPGQTGG